MKIRFGLAIGFAVGYYLGAMAGRERFDQLNRLMGRAARSDLTHMAAEKSLEVVDLGYERAKDGVQHTTHRGFHRNGNSQPDVSSPS